MVDVADSKSADGDIVWVRVPPPAPRQNKAARSCGGTSTATSTGDLVFPFPSQTHSVGLCDGTGSVFSCPGAPRQKNSAPFRFRGLRKSRENCTSAESFFLSKSEDPRGSSDLVLCAGSDMNCPGAPERGHPKGCPLSGAAPSARYHPLRSNLPEGIPNPLRHRPMQDRVRKAVSSGELTPRRS